MTLPQIDGGEPARDREHTERLFAAARQVADVVLYEGYVLYPYRASAIKNRFRWQFGIVAPRGYGECGGADPWFLQTECLVEADGDPRLDIEVRYLHVEERRVEEEIDGGELRPVESLVVGDETFTSWQEGLPRTIVPETMALPDMLDVPRRIVAFAPAESRQQTLHENGRRRGLVSWERRAIKVALEVTAQRIGPLWKLRLRVENETPWKPSMGADRAAAMLQACTGTHALLAIEGGRFLSLADPPGAAVEAARSCQQEHAWPVLLGERDQARSLLASPIILDDYPQIAPESPGDLYDATEIDEILTLRIMTLTDEEKAEARSTDPRARRVIDRSDTIPDEIFARLHGVIRSLRPISGGETITPPDLTAAPLDTAPAPADVAPAPPDVAPDPLAGAPDPWRDLLGEATPPELAEIWVGSSRIVKGSRVELHPKRKADAMDMFLEHKLATVAAVYHDIEGVAYVAVTLDDDPGRDLHDWYGRFYYFYPEEIEPIAAGAGTPPAHGTKELA